MKLQAAKCMALCALTLAAGGCSSSGSSDYSEYWTAIKQSFGATLGASRVTLQQAAAIPYASMGYRVDHGPERVIVLATDNGGEQLWTSSEHVVLLARGGQIVRSVGLPHDLGGTTYQGDADNAHPAAALQHDFSATRYVDFPDMGAYSVPIACTARSKGRRNVTILGQSITTVRVEESCRSERLGWSFTDIYWVDETSGMVWRSVQHIHPKGSEIDTEILRPPG